MTGKIPPGASRSSSLIGAPLSFQIERQVDGQFPASRLPQLVEWIALNAHRRGRSRVESGSLIWENTSDVEAVTIRVIPGAGRTRIWLLARYGAMAAFTFFVAFFVGMFLTAAFGGFALGIRSFSGGAILATAGVLLSYLVGRQLWRNFARRRERELEALVQGLEQLMGRTRE